MESIRVNEDPVNHWEELCLENTMYIHNDSTAEAPLHLQDDWLTPLEQEHKQRDLQRQHHIRNSFTPTSTQPIMTPTQLPKVNDTANSEGASTPTFIQGPSPTIIPPYVPADATQPTLSTPLLPTPCCSECTNKGQYTQTKYSDKVYCNMTNPTQNQNAYEQQLAYTAELFTCCDTGFHDITDPRVYAAKTRQNDPDSPTFHQAINGENAEEYIKAMQTEIATLILQRTWDSVPRTKDLNVLKGTWVFKLKRLPDGTPYQFKARFCARGDLQKERIDFFETYAPVVLWSTIRLLLSTVLTEGWIT